MQIALTWSDVNHNIQVWILYDLAFLTKAAGGNTAAFFIPVKFFDISYYACFSLSFF
jgi:hypothetical protein